MQQRPRRTADTTREILRSHVNPDGRFWIERGAKRTAQPLDSTQGKPSDRTMPCPEWLLGTILRLGHTPLMTIMPGKLSVP